MYFCSCSLFNEGLFLCKHILTFYKKIAIFEDDCTFTKDFKPKFEKFVYSLPADYEALWLGANYQGGCRPINAHVARAVAYAAHAYILKESVFQYIIDT